MPHSGMRSEYTQIIHHRGVMFFVGNGGKAFSVNVSPDSEANAYLMFCLLLVADGTP